MRAAFTCTASPIAVASATWRRRGRSGANPHAVSDYLGAMADNDERGARQDELGRKAIFDEVWLIRRLDVRVKVNVRDRCQGVAAGATAGC